MTRPVKIALIGATATVLAAIIGAVSWKSCNPSSIQYTGQVVNEKDEPIKNAKVTFFEDQKPGEDHDTDSNGIFTLSYNKNAQSARVSIRANGYQNLDRNISPTGRTGIEKFPLKLVKEDNNPEDLSNAYKIQDNALLGKTIENIAAGLFTVQIQENCNLYLNEKLSQTALPSTNPFEQIKSLPRYLKNKTLKSSLMVFIQKGQGEKTYEISCKK